MKDSRSSLADLSDTDLLAQVKRLAEGERHATAQLIASLAELDARRLYLGEGCSSLFTYCTQSTASLGARRVRPHRGGASHPTLPH